MEWYHQSSKIYCDECGDEGESEWLGDPAQGDWSYIPSIDKVHCPEHARPFTRWCGAYGCDAEGSTFDENAHLWGYDPSVNKHYCPNCSDNLDIEDLEKRFRESSKWYHEPAHHDFFRRQIKAFRKAGGSVYVLNPADDDDFNQMLTYSTSVRRQLRRHKMMSEKIDQQYSDAIDQVRGTSKSNTANQIYREWTKRSDQLNKIKTGLEYMASICDVNQDHNTYSAERYIVATNVKNQPVAIMSFRHPADYNYDKDLQIHNLGSNGTFPGGATAVEYALAHVAANNNQKVSSEYASGARGYHELIGRTGISNGQSNWSKKACQDIANLPLFPKSITKDWY